MNILIAEDEKDYRKIITKSLDKDNHNYDEATNIKSCENYLEKNTYDVILLDWDLNSQQTGLDLCRKIKSNEFSQDPIIIFITGKIEPEFTVKALESGADDFINKPFSLEVLKARIKKAVHNKKHFKQNPSYVKTNCFELDCEKVEVKYKNKKIDNITLKEFKLLKAFLENPDKTFSRRSLNAIISGENIHITSRNIDVHLVSLRKKISNNLVQNIRGMGYRLNQEVLE